MSDEPLQPDQLQSPKDRAFMLYLQDVKIKEIAADVNHSIHTIRQWIKDGGWRTKKDEVRAESQRLYMDQYFNFITEKKYSVSKLHLFIQTELLKKVTAMLRDPRKLRTSDDMLNLSRAAKAAADVGARAVGISDRAQEGGNIRIDRALVYNNLQPKAIDTRKPESSVLDDPGF